MTSAEWLLICGMALVTFAIRYPVLAMSGRLKLPEWLLKALNYIPPAVLTAIIVPAIFVESDDLWFGWQNPRIAGAIAALMIGFWRKNLLLTITVGMSTFLLWQFVV